MDISSIQEQNSVIEGIKELNDMLKSVNDAQTGLSNKLIKANTVSKVLGLGDNVDIHV